jgi:hypothetical protein
MQQATPIRERGNLIRKSSVAGRPVEAMASHAAAAASVSRTGKVWRFVHNPLVLIAEAAG